MDIFGIILSVWLFPFIFYLFFGKYMKRFLSVVSPNIRVNETGEFMLTPLYAHFIVLIFIVFYLFLIVDNIDKLVILLVLVFFSKENKITKKEIEYCDPFEEEEWEETEHDIMRNRITKIFSLK